jgi:hypothetical protein
MRGGALMACRLASTPFLRTLALKVKVAGGFVRVTVDVTTSTSVLVEVTVVKSDSVEVIVAASVSLRTWLVVCEIVETIVLDGPLDGN